MDETAKKPSKSVKRKGYILLMYVPLIIIVGAVVGWCLYHSQHTQVESLTSKTANQSAQLSSLNTQINAAKAAGDVTASKWKTYCDPHGIFCFKYPPGWTITPGYISDEKIGSVTLTNPSKTLTVNYLDNYMKDGFAGNFIVHSIKALNVGNNNLALLGGYYIQTIGYTPQYEVVTVGTGVNSPALSDKSGQDIFAPSPPGFTYNGGTYADTIGQFYIQPTSKTFSTVQQANAWYSSIDGKTAYLIAASLYTKS